MAIEFWCECGRQLRLMDGYAGTRVTCPACGRAMTVPPPLRPDSGLPPYAPVVPPDYLPQAKPVITREAARARCTRALWLGLIGLGLSIMVAVVATIIGSELQRPGAAPEVSPALAVLMLVSVLAAAAAGVCAIVLGVMGLRSPYGEHKGAAICGLVLGIVDFCLSGCCLGLMALGALEEISKHS